MTTINQSICGKHVLSSDHQKVKESEIASIRREDFAWLAGLFDGEGNINMGIYHNGIKEKPEWKTFHVGCVITNTHADCIEKVTEILEKLNLFFKVQLRKREKANHRFCFSLTIQGHKQAEKFLRTILPFLTNKKEQALQALLALEYRNTLNRGGNNRFEKNREPIYSNPILLKMCERMKELCHFRPDVFSYSRVASQKMYCKKPSETTRLTALSYVQLMADDIVRTE